MMVKFNARLVGSAVCRKAVFPFLMALSVLQLGCGTGGNESDRPVQHSALPVSSKIAEQETTSPPPVYQQLPPSSQDRSSQPVREKVESAGGRPVTDQGARTNADLIAATGDERLIATYKRYEEMLGETPGDLALRMGRVNVLAAAGGVFHTRQDRDHALMAAHSAFQLAQTVISATPDPGDEYHELLSQVYYNGACCQALGGDAGTARGTLRNAIEWGFADTGLLHADADLTNVRALPGFDADVAGWIVAARQAMLDRGRGELSRGHVFPFNFSVTDIGGHALELTHYRGKIVIVDFWGTWCDPCEQMVPSLIRLQNEYGPRGLQIIGLAYERTTANAANPILENFVESRGINYPCALGTAEIRDQIPRFQALPTMLFLDRTGVVRLQAVGANGYQYLESVVLALLEEPTADAN